MPPAASRATAAAAGRAKAAASKQTVQIRGKRKSIATDPALLQGSSDEDGEGPQDHEELPNSLQEQPAQRLNSKSISSKSSAKHKKTVLGASDGDVSTSSPRRSTRLSGEGVVGSQYTTAGASTSRNARNRRDDPSQSRETLPGSKTPSALGNKRKAPSSGTAPKTAASTHPTPPETDSDTASRRQPSRSRTQSSTDRQSPKPKKLKGTSGETSQPTQTRAPSPPPSDQSDDSDNFAFTRVEQAPSASAPSTSRQVASEAVSQTTLPRATAPARTASTSRNESHTNRAKVVSTKKTTSQASTSADLLQSLKQARQNGTHNQASSSTLAAAAAANPAGETVRDRKGKRKAEESAGEETEVATDQTGSTRQSSASTQSSRVPAKGKLKKGRVAELSREDLEDAVPLQPPDPGTPSRPSSSSSSTHVPINTQETPAIQRNLAMRAGLGYGVPPGTPGSARRASSDMRGKRGSSIGNGLEALPHPSLPSDTLYRHIKADDPPAVRFRTLVTWSAHRLKEASQAQSRTASTEVRAAVSRIMDSLIADLVEKRIDLSWQAADPQQDDISTAKLPPNPENEANQAKLESCQAWIERLQEEDKARNARINQYKTMTERITKLITPLPPSTSSTSTDIPDLLQPNWSLPIPRFKDKSDMLEYGKKLLQPKPSSISTRRKSATAASAADTQDPNLVNVQDEYPVDYNEIRHQASSLAQNSYRVNQFLNLADTFITQHIAKTQTTLSQITRGSSRDAYLAGVGVGAGAGSSKGKDSQEDAQSTTRALLESAPGIRSVSRKNRGGGMDALTLLRAISRAESTVESSKKNSAR